MTGLLGGRERPRVLDASLSAVLADARRARGWSLRAAGAAASVSHTHVRRLELGWCRPSESVAGRVAAGYGLDEAEAAALLAAAWRWSR